MGKLEELEQQVRTISPDELARFRAWSLEFDWAAWDRRIGADIRVGKLDTLAEKALRERASGTTMPL